jgi:hypothetical protein
MSYYKPPKNFTGLDYLVLFCFIIVCTLIYLKTNNVNFLNAAGVGIFLFVVVLIRNM